jgi:hypothetical protein
MRGHFITGSDKQQLWLLSLAGKIMSASGITIGPLPAGSLVQNDPPKRHIFYVSASSNKVLL